MYWNVLYCTAMYCNVMQCTLFRHGSLGSLDLVTRRRADAAARASARAVLALLARLKEAAYARGGRVEWREIVSALDASRSRAIARQPFGVREVCA